MPRRMLTDRFCANAKVNGADVQTDYFDEASRGLALRVSRTGLRSWTYHFTWAGKRVRMTFGTYPATSLGSARTHADEAKGYLETGKDPRSLRTKPDTFKAICEEYLQRDGAALRSGALRKATLERLVYPRLGDLPISDIRRSDIIRVLDTIEDESGPVMADWTLAVVRKIMNWHASRSDDFRSPIVRGMSRTKPKERARERTLTDDEIRAVWAASDGVFGHYVQFLLLTATRRNEAARITSGEVRDGIWTIPAARMKGKAEHVVPLSAAALAVIGAGGGAATGGSSPFVFTTGTKALNGFSKYKREFDKTCGVTGWTLHDLRRTARSLMSRAGVSADVAERCLAHTIGGVRGTYDRHEYLEEKARAFEALAAQIERIVNPQENVVPIGRQR
ncbi:MAG TPA: integrase arm-type DNA-binding domain-containing protein [Xanthobacteraceae bacterium]|jgi:integrase|nr:integrase arm-type DNA-binding domain-containing protein [Xanthobacteraceae bacterium]